MSSSGRACPVAVLETAHDCTFGAAGAGAPFWIPKKMVGQLGPSVDVVGLLVHGCHQSVLLVAVVGPVTNMFK